MLRVGLAFLVVSLIYPLGILLLADQGSVGGAISVSIFTIGVSVLLGIPLVAWCVRRGWIRLWQSSLAGAVAGAVCACVFFTAGLNGLLLVAGPFAIVGAAHGSLFWLLAFWRNEQIQRARSASA